MVSWRVTKLKVLPGHRLEVAFADGRSGVVDLSKDRFDGVLAPLADEAFFAQARIQEDHVGRVARLEVAAAVPHLRSLLRSSLP